MAPGDWKDEPQKSNELFLGHLASQGGTTQGRRAFYQVPSGSGTSYRPPRLDPCFLIKSRKSKFGPEAGVLRLHLARER